jgi:formamidopyrimidine-DNA glycosylase
MPELPEVETIRRQLEPIATGRRIERVEVLDERWVQAGDPRELERVAAGRTIEAIERRGKYLLLRLDGGWTLEIHLRMTGNLVLAPAGSEPKYLRAVIRLEGGEDLLFVDARRFGHGELVRSEDVERRFEGKLGVEPLGEGFTAEVLGALAAGRKAPLKSFLLGQASVAGIGNIYADEALFRAALHPLSPAGSMRPEHWTALHAGIVGALEAGLAGGGASIDDYRDARGERGSMQDEFLVHRREGRPCPRCGESIRRVVVAGRSTYFCPACQVRLRARPRPGAGGRRRAAAAGGRS